MKLNELTGQKFGRLTVLRRAGTVNKRTRWECVCDCGNKVIVEAYNLTKGHTQSCGCLQKEATSKASTTHGMRKTRLYRIWNCMHNRCYYSKYHAYKHYGGRGIVICKEWKDDFKVFADWAFSHGYADNLSIDRIDPNGNYSPNNCRWVTMETQNKNKRAPNGLKIKEM